MYRLYTCMYTCNYMYVNCNGELKEYKFLILESSFKSPKNTFGGKCKKKLFTRVFVYTVVRKILKMFAIGNIRPLEVVDRKSKAWLEADKTIYHAHKNKTRILTWI